MQLPLLETKIRVPPLPPHALPRERLVAVLAQRLPGARLGLVAAPAGYGKTTLLAQWADGEDAPTVAWLSLDEGDDDIERFFRYLAAAWERAQPGVLQRELGLLLGSVSPDNEAVLATFLNEAHGLKERTVFVLDDYHVIEDEAIHQAVTFLLDNLPPQLCFVLASRGEPPLPLARYRARRQLVQLGPEALHFRQGETAQFLAAGLGLNVADEEVARLQQETEGWIAALQLAGLGLQGGGVQQEARETPGMSPVAKRARVSGRQRYIADYLAEDVLAQQEREVRDFLLRTAGLERLCGALCDFLLEAEAGYGQQMLERLERANLLLSALDDERVWFRYHRLFAEFLRQEARRQLALQSWTEIQRRAAQWHLDHDFPEVAFEQAMAAEDLALVSQVVERYFVEKLHAGEYRLLRRWLDAIPPAWNEANPMFTLARAGVCLHTGAIDACFQCVEKVEQALSTPQNQAERQQLARSTAVRCFIACYKGDLTEAERYAKEALRTLQEEDHAFRADTYQALGDAYRRYGYWEEAEACYREVLSFTLAPTFHQMAPHVYGALADLAMRRGQLREAEKQWRKALAALDDPQNWGQVSLPAAGWLYARLGEILYEWNHLEEAAAHLARGLERAELGGDVQALIAGYLLAGRLALARGDTDAAEAQLEEARTHVEGTDFPGWAARFERLQLELWLAQDRLRAAVHWADEIVAQGADAERLDGAERQLALARVLIVKGDGPSLQRASTLLEALSAVGEEEGRTQIVIESSALRALARWRRDDDAGGAMRALERALRLAEPEGYVRLFADLGLAMGRLLQEARSRRLMARYVEVLLAAFGDEVAQRAAGQRAAGQPLTEPLTDREQEVLALMAAGLTNREIAKELVISAGTVKKHAANIYGKLGVGSRTEAAARARELSLLGE